MGFFWFLVILGAVGAVAWYIIKDAESNKQAEYERKTSEIKRIFASQGLAIEDEYVDVLIADGNDPYIAQSVFNKAVWHTMLLEAKGIRTPGIPKYVTQEIRESVIAAGGVPDAEDIVSFLREMISQEELVSRSKARASKDPAALAIASFGEKASALADASG